MSDTQKLNLIFGNIYSMVRSIQVDRNFDSAIEKETKKSYIEMKDDDLFQYMVDIVYQSGLRGAVWAKYEPVIREVFANYNPRKVARYTKKDIETILLNPKMLKNRCKANACVFNAKKLLRISKDCNGFWRFLEGKSEDLVETLKSNFRFMSYTNAYAFLRYVGFPVLKPDVNVVNVLYRLGLISSDKKTPETFKQVQKMGCKMAEASHVKTVVVDYTLFQFGAGEKRIVSDAICGIIPRCEECTVRDYCKWLKLKLAPMVKQAHEYISLMTKGFLV